MAESRGGGSAGGTPAVAQDRRLLVISYHFPPDEAVGGLRWFGITKYLTRLGWRSWVLTGAPPRPDLLPNGVLVESCGRLRTANDIYRQIRHAGRPEHGRESARPSTSPSPGARDGRAVRLVRALRREGAALLTIPDEARGWVLRAALHGRRLIAQTRPDVLVSSGPPHSAHIVAWLATRFTGVRWFVDLRDPWSGPVTKPWDISPVYRSPWMTRLMALIEARVVRAADGVICNARNFARVMARQYPATRVEFVPNAVDTDSLPRHVGATPHRLAVACTGTIYGERDLRPLLAALRRFIDRHPEAPSSAVKLRVAGHTDSPRGHAARIEAAKLELAAHVEWLGIIPRKEVWQLLSQSGLGVVLAQDQGFQVPAKLYELVGIGVPTLVIAERGSASAEEGERVGAYVVSPDDQEGMGAVLEAVWSGHARPPAVTAQAVGYQQLADAVHALLADRGRDRR